MEQEFNCDVKLVNLIFSVNDEEKRRLIALSHVRPTDEEKNFLVIDAPTADNLQNTVNVITRYGE